MILELRVVACDHCGYDHGPFGDLPPTCQMTRNLNIQINSAAQDWVRDNPDEFAQIQANLRRLEAYGR